MLLPTADNSLSVIQEQTIAIGEQSYLTQHTQVAAPEAREMVDAKRLELVFINSDTPDYQALLDDLMAERTEDRNVAVYLLDANRNGVEQIGSILAGYSDVDAIHLVSHAENDAVKLGNTWLSENSLSGNAGELAKWRSSLASDADFLLYGCDLAANQAGQTLLEGIHELTGADVAASIDATGHERWGGNWSLEYHVGVIESEIAFSGLIEQNWGGKLATITVTTFNDVVNSSDGVLSLREAIIQANSGAGGDTIVLSAGTYTLTLAGSGENNALTGDLDIRNDMTIRGASATTTIIDGNGIDRVFHIAANNVTLTMSALTIQGGNTTLDGGAIHLQFTNAQLDLSNVVITGNNARNGAGIFNEGTIDLVDVVFSGNGSSSSIAGGAVFNSRDATLNRVSIYGNQAIDGGGIYESGRSLSLTNSTISGNTALAGGGGISNQASVTILNSTIANNTAATGGGINNPNNTIRMTNTIIAGNTATGSGPDVNGAINSQGNNLVQGTLGASGFITSDITGINPTLGPLADNGGLTRTHALLTGSAAIGAGSLVGAPNVDQRGTYRLGIADIGAFEYTPTLTRTGEWLVNTTTTSSQVTSAQTRGSQDAVSLAADGSYAVVWSSLNQDGSGWGVYARRFNAAGVAITGEILVNQTTGNDQKWARVASADNGSFVVTWTSDSNGSSPSVYFRMFAANGTALGAEQLANNTTSNSPSNSVIGMDQSTGRFVIAWQGDGPDDNTSIFFRRFAANGTALDPNDRLANTATELTAQDAAIAMQTDGAFVIAWEAGGGDDDEDAAHVYFQRFDETGAKVGSETQIDNPLSTSFGIDIASDDEGNFTVAYREQNIATGIWTRGYSANGSQRYTWMNRSGGDATSPSIAMFGDGSHIITWQRTGDGSGLGVYAQRFNANGTTNGAAFLVNQTTNGSQSQPSVAAIDSENFVIVWSGEGPGDSDGVFARQYFIGDVAPLITSNGGLATASITIAENSTAVTTVTASDTDLPAQVLTYSISGGLDSSRFTINGSTGALRFITAPDFESPSDFGSNGIYDVIVQVSDGALTDTQSIAVTVTNANDPPLGVSDNYTLQEDSSLTTAANWFDNAWSTRKGITFNNTSGPNLVDQVVLVTLNSSNIDYGLTQNSGQDLRFVDTDGTVLNYEIERWDEAGTSTVWVRVPQINGASATDSIWMYFGNATATAGQNVAGVWPSSAHAVLHMSGTVVDSSLQANAVVNNGTSSTNGFISGGRSFDGIDDEINLGSASAIDDIFSGGGTLSAWINPTGWGENGFGRIADKASSTFANSSLGNGWAIQVNGSNGSLMFEQGHSTATGEWRTGAGTISLNVWQHIAVTYDSSSTTNNPRIFINGVEVAVIEGRAPAGTAGSDAASNLKIGNYSQSPDRTFAGAIDEFQLHNISLTADQIRANYQSMSGTLVSLDSVSSGPGGVLTNDTDIEGATLGATLVTGPSHQQSFTLRSDGSFTYVPTANYTGTDFFSYSVTDGVNSTGPVTVTLTITGVNDNPIITSLDGLTNASISTSENTTTVTTVTASDPDLPSSPLSYSLTGGSDQGRFSIGATTGY